MTTTRLGLLRAGAASLLELMGQRVPSANVNEIQGNPFQPDVNFRCISASPLLGTPQDVHAANTWRNENGWRDCSPSTAGHWLAEVGEHSQTCDLDLAGRPGRALVILLALADNAGDAERRSGAAERQIPRVLKVRCRC